MLADSGPNPVVNRQALLDVLCRQVRQIEGLQDPSREIVSTGVPALDQVLPGNGLRRGTLVEWLAGRTGTGVVALAFLAARQATLQEQSVVVCDRNQQFYAPAAIALGLKPAQLVVLQPATDADELWALDQSLRCPGVAVVWASLPRLREHDFRRLQLAAEEGKTLGLLRRPGKVRGHPSWSEVQFFVEPLASQANRRLRVEVVRVRGGVAGASVVLEIDDITGQVREVPEHETLPLPTTSRLAAAATRRRQA